MGGRLALHIALAAPERVDAVSCSWQRRPASRTPTHARGAVHDDERLAPTRSSESRSRQFADRWTEQPLFAGDGRPTPSSSGVEDIARNDPIALAAALRGIGAGAMAPLWDRLARADDAGDGGHRRDLTRRTSPSAAGSSNALPASQPLVVIDGAGHGLPRERPAAVAAAFAAARPVSSG